MGNSVLHGVEPKKVLVVKPSSLGDVVHSLPFLNSIRTCFPHAEVHWVIAKGLEGLLAGHPMIDKLIVIDKDSWKRISRSKKTAHELKGLYNDLRRENYDVTIDLQGLLRSGLIARASGSPVRIGFREAREGSRLFYTHTIEGGKEVHAVDRYMKIAGALGCDTQDVVFPFPLTGDVPARGGDIMAGTKEYAVLVAGARWDTKVWPAEYFGRVAAMLPFKSVVIGSGSDAAIAGEVVRASQGKAFSVAGTTDLGELLEIIRAARLVISNDSGPMHIAAGFRIPVVAIFGPTSPERTGPYGEGHIVIKSPVGCSPCFKKSCRDLRCMRAVTPEMVFEKIRPLFPGRQ